MFQRIASFRKGFPTHGVIFLDNKSIHRTTLKNRKTRTLSLDSFSYVSSYVNHLDFLFPQSISCPATESLFSRTAGTSQTTDSKKHYLLLPSKLFVSLEHWRALSFWRCIIYKQIILLNPTFIFFYLPEWSDVCHGIVCQRF